MDQYTSINFLKLSKSIRKNFQIKLFQSFLKIIALFFVFYKYILIKNVMYNTIYLLDLFYIFSSIIFIPKKNVKYQHMKKQFGRMLERTEAHCNISIFYKFIQQRMILKYFCLKRQCFDKLCLKVTSIRTRVCTYVRLLCILT